MERLGVSTVLGALLVAGAAQGQLSRSAYRVLGQSDLRSNGLNMVRGVELRNPSALALDSRGGQLHVYICDTGNARVLAWADAASYQIGDSPALVIGQPGEAYSGAYGIGTKGFQAPTALAVDLRNGDLYVADSAGNRVLRFRSPFASASRIEPDAVYGQPNFATVAAGSSASNMNAPRGLAVDPSGNLWVSDTGNHRILRFAAAALDNSTPPAADMVIGQQDFTSVSANRGGAPSASTLYSPAGLTFDGSGNLYVADTGNARVLRFQPPDSAGGSISARAVWGQSSFTARGVPSQASASTLKGPVGVALDGAGNLYVATPLDDRVLIFSSTGSGGPANAVIGQADFTTTTPNTGAFPLASANVLSSPTDVEVDPNGNVYVADMGNHRVLRFAAGSKSARSVWGQSDFTANGPNQVKPGSINMPYKMAIDYSTPPYALYVSDTGNHRVLIWNDATAFRNGDPADLVIGQPDLRTAIPNVDTQATVKPSQTSLFAPEGIALNPYSGALYVADAGNNRVLRYPRPVDQKGRITPDAVIGQADFSSATSAVVTAASLNGPSGLAFGADGRLFVADTGNNRVLEFPDGAGFGAAAVRIYGQPNAVSAVKPAQLSSQTLAGPRGLFVDAGGNLFVADTGGNRVVVFADTTSAPQFGAAAAYTIGAGLLKTPVDVASDSAGNTYVTDSGNNRVLIFSTPISITGPSLIDIVGQPDTKSTSANWDGSNGLASADSLYAPYGLYIDRQDTVYVGDAGNNRVVHFPKAVVTMNAATFQANGSVAAGALATVVGRSLAGDTAGASSETWPTTLANRKLALNDEVEAPLSFVSPGQVNFQAPSNLPPGLHRVAIKTADTGELVAGGSILIDAVSPGLFTASQNGSGQGLILNQDGTRNGPSNAAAIGSTITLFGTGQGRVSPAVADGAPAPGPPMAVTVAVPTADGTTCLSVQPSMCVAVGSGFGVVQASGLAPGSVGVWQIQVTIPKGIATGGAVPLRVVIAGRLSNIVTVAIK